MGDQDGRGNVVMIRPTDGDVKAYLEECGVNHPTTEQARQERQHIGDMLRTVSAETLMAALSSRGISYAPGSFRAHRGDDVEAWIRRTRDEYDRNDDADRWDTLDLLLDEYCGLADTGTPLGAPIHVGNPAAIPLCGERWGPLTCFLAAGHGPEVAHRYGGPEDLGAQVETTETGGELIDDDPEPVFVIKAHDDVAVAAITCYRDSCVARGLYRQAAEVQDALNEIKAWRRRNPDHPHVPAGHTGSVS